MCTEAVDVSFLATCFAAIMSWLTLAGFLLFPTTYQIGPKFLAQSSEAALHDVKVLIALCVVGTCGQCLMWYIWRDNCVLLLAKIF